MTTRDIQREMVSEIARDIISPSQDTSGPVAAWSNDFRNQSLGGLALTRASNAGYYDASGTWVVAAADAPRFDHHPATLAARGLLSEETRTNFLLNSASPSSQTVSLNAGSYTLWVEGAGSCVCAAGTAAGSGFGTATAGSKVTFSISTAGTVVFTVTGGLARFQCENGIAETSFITTTSAAATRAGDVCGANMSSVLNAQEGTVFVQGTVGHGQPSALGMDDGSGGAATRMHIMLTATARTYFVNIDNVARINGNDSGLMAIGTPVKVAGTYGPQGSALYVNGMVAASSGTASGGLNVSHLRIGSRNLPTAGRQLNGWIQRAAYYRQSLGLESIKKIME